MNQTLLEIAEWLRQNPQETGGDLYHPLPFPEFQSLRTSSRAHASERKWGLIERSMDRHGNFSGLTALDIGANAGYFSFSLARGGAHVVAYEPHPHYASLGSRIAQATSLDVTWLQRPIAVADLDGARYDMALMLSVFQWISDGNRRLDHATEVLRAVYSSTRSVYFELGCNAGKSAIEVNGSSLLWTYRLLRRHTAPKRVHYLGSSTAWGRARRHMFVATDGDVRLAPRQRMITFMLEHARPESGDLP
jgi:FkbM family methyltransferase